MAFDIFDLYCNLKQSWESKKQKVFTKSSHDEKKMSFLEEDVLEYHVPLYPPGHLQQHFSAHSDSKVIRAQ